MNNFTFELDFQVATPIKSQVNCAAMVVAKSLDRRDILEREFHEMGERREFTRVFAQFVSFADFALNSLDFATAMIVRHYVIDELRVPHYDVSTISAAALKLTRKKHNPNH